MRWQIIPAVVVLAGAGWAAGDVGPGTEPGRVLLNGQPIRVQLKVGPGGAVDSAVIVADTQSSGEVQPGQVVGPVVGRAMGEGDWEKHRTQVLAAIREAAEGNAGVEEKIRAITAAAMKMPGDPSVQEAGMAALAKLGKEAAPKLRAAAAGQNGAEATLLAAAAFEAEHGFSPVEAVRKWIVEKGDGEKGAAPGPRMVADPALGGLFKDRAFLTVTVPAWPVARLAPKPLAQQNVFAVDGRRQITHLTSARGLEEYFRANLPAVQDEATAKQAMNAWLALSPEFSQDGMFQFVIDEKGIKYEPGPDGKRSKVSGAAVVKGNGGNSGAVTAVLTFADGKLEKVDETRQLRAGVRPICQSTKLLDPDPIVRKMAERDILVMGIACREYLEEQRAKVSPELQAAIDRIWRQILDEGR